MFEVAALNLPNCSFRIRDKNYAIDERETGEKSTGESNVNYYSAFYLK